MHSKLVKIRPVAKNISALGALGAGFTFGWFF